MAATSSATPPATRRETRAADADRATADSARLSIGALSRASGVPVETLRAWEQRYGFPAADRKPSGHRVYPLATVARLRRMSEAIAAGHRAGQVVGASDAQLDALLEASAGPRPGPGRPPIPSTVTQADLLSAIAAFDTDALTSALLSEWARLGPLDFLRARVAPLVEHVGAEWAHGRLEIRHEHFLSERLGDLLRSLRLAFDGKAEGPTVVAATLPGETHAVGLQMAALVMAASGLRVSYLGTDVPVAQIAAAARDLGARAVAVSISAAADRKRTRRQVAQLESVVPREVTVLLGGAGAGGLRTNAPAVTDLGELERWSRRLADSRQPITRAGVA